MIKPRCLILFEESCRAEKTRKSYLFQLENFMKAVYIIAIAVGCSVVISVIGFYLYQEMSRQAILGQTREGYEYVNFKES